MKVFLLYNPKLHLCNLYILLLSCITFTSTAQDPDPALFENTWYLYESQEAIGVGPQVVSSIEPQITPKLTIAEDFNFNGIGACNQFNGTFQSDSENHIATITFSSTNNTCQNAMHSQLETSFFNALQGISQYLLLNENEILTLEFSSPFGDYLLFKNTKLPLGLEDNTLSYIEIYPNPVTNKLFIQSNTPLEKGSIYSLTGTLLKEVPLKANTSINVQGLTSGLYFVTLEDEKGSLLTKKFVKQ